MTKGFFYISYGPPRFLEEAICSAESVRRAMPNANIALLTDRPTDSQVFDKVEVDTNLPPTGDLKWDKFEKRIYNHLRSPWDFTCILDTDTYVISDISRHFDLLNHFDIALCTTPGERTILHPDPPHKPMTGLKTYTNGVMFFRKSGGTAVVFNRTCEYYEKLQHLYKASKSTNRYLTMAIAVSKAKVYTLPLTMNVRCRHTQALDGKAEVLHSSSGKTKMNREAYEAVAAKINKQEGHRLWYPMTEE